MMNKREENRKENRHALGKFLIVLVAAGILGGVVGFLSEMMNLSLQELFGEAYRLIYDNMLWIMIVFAVIFQVIMWSFIIGAKKLFSQWSGDEDATSKKIDIKIGHVMVIANILMIGSLIMFGWRTSGIIASNGDYSETMILVVVFIVNAAGVIIGQKMAVDLTKEMNPEKKGSVFDTNFQKKWLETCDERERQQTYQCAWQAFKVMNIVFVVALLLCFFLSDIAGIGTAPGVIVGILWLIQTSIYSVYAIKLSK